MTAGIMQSPCACPYCGSTESSFCFRASDRWHKIDGVYTMTRCNDCALLFLNPQPTAEELARHYPLTYYSYEGERSDAQRDERLYRIFYGPKSSVLNRLLFSPYRTILRTFVGGPNQRVLDVGCGSGHFLAIGKKLYEMDAYGVEPFSYNSEFAEKNGLKILNCTLEQACFPEAFFDGVTLNAVFEHLPDPVATLGELRRILKPGGTLIIGVPQSRCLLYWVFGKHWWQLDVPRHLTVPSPSNLKRLAEKLGFKVKGIRYNSTPTSILATLFYWRTRSVPGGKFFYEYTQSKWGFRALLPLSYALNALQIGDQLEILLTA